MVNGYNREWDVVLSLRGCAQLHNLSVRATLYGYANQSHPCMCTWAFTLLRSSRVSLGLDFRCFHDRFSRLHKGQGARCQFESSDPCDGSHPLSCGRFRDKRLVREEQSLHDESCPRGGSCGLVIWDGDSYRQIRGPRAVSLAASVPGKVTYTQANEVTMAISHVWSHGQRSRLHTGINQCLHQRYVDMARAHCCTSYWIDSMCIPESHDLRSEALRYINRIFVDSKIVLVCDRDLMVIDISSPKDMALLEAVLATFFVCDWNVRAWTLLEAMKGSHALHLLCRYNNVIFPREALIKVHEYGSVDISILCLSVQHLTPPPRRPAVKVLVRVQR